MLKMLSKMVVIVLKNHPYILVSKIIVYIYYLVKKNFLSYYFR